MALNVCNGCTTKFAVGLPRCPHCASTDFCEDGQMAKITAQGGPSDKTLPEADEAAPAEAGLQGEPGPELLDAPDDAAVASVASEEDGGESSPEGDSADGAEEPTESEVAAEPEKAAPRQRKTRSRP